MNLRDELQHTLGSAYTLERELGGGGMSRVFVADEARLRRKVVVKVLSPEMAEGISAERFEREIQLAASLQQANIVPVLNAGDAAGMPYYTMPFVEGESLRARLAAGPLSIPETVSILRDVARALAYAHERGIVHRDIKPDNVLLSRGTAVVTDFGIAKALAASQTHVSGATLTRAGIALGTPAYMSPEQAAGDPDVGYPADFYAFGCMGFELLTGRPPFADRSLQKLLMAHLHETAPSVTDLRNDTPPELARLISRCMAKDAADRPQSADELLSVLESTSAGDAPQLSTVILLGQRGILRNALAVYAVAFVLVAVAAKVAITQIGLPEWVFPGALIVMALGLPVILFTAYAQYITRRGTASSPTLTPGGSVANAGTMATIAAKASPMLSWRRTALGGIAAVGAFALAIGAFMLLRAFGIGPAGSLFAAGRLAERDRLIVTDFRVRGADSSLGSVISEAVRTELGQSKVVTILSLPTIAGALRRMQRPPTAPLDLALAREVAQREGAKAVVDGDITPLGNGFVVALRKYADARRANNFEVDYRKSVTLLEEAIALDSGFAMAYRNLGLAYGNLDYPREKSDSAFAKAYRFRDRLTERERYLTAANYFGGPARDRARQAAAEEDFLARYPHDYAMLSNLGIIYESRRAFARAESLYRRSIAENPNSRISLMNLGGNLLSQGRVAEAAKVAAEMRAQAPNAPDNLGMANLLAQARGPLDSAEATTRAALASVRDPQFRARFTNGLSLYALVHGRLAEARRLRAEARAMNVERGADTSPLDAALDEANIEAWFEERSASATAVLDSALAHTSLSALAVDQRRDFRIASTYALAGRADRARAALARFDADVKDTTIRRFMEPQRHWALSEIAIAEGRARDAIDEIRKADMLPDGPADDCARCTYAALARAFDLAGMADSAIVTFERYLATPYWRPINERSDATHLAGTYKRLGELYEAKGDRERASSYYSKFVELWKNADPVLQPKVAEVRKRLARLSDTEPR
jgi:tetratricopeptide (TPR) repeat protein